MAFSAPFAGSVRVYIASKSIRGTDGTFLQENVVATGSLTDSEIQSGKWLDSSQIAPGSYVVMLEASPTAAASAMTPTRSAGSRIRRARMGFHRSCS